MAAGIGSLQPEVGCGVAGVQASLPLWNHVDSTGTAPRSIKHPQEHPPPSKHRVFWRQNVFLASMVRNVCDGDVPDLWKRARGRASLGMANVTLRWAPFPTASLQPPAFAFPTLGIQGTEQQMRDLGGAMG